MGRPEDKFADTRRLICRQLDVFEVLDRMSVATPLSPLIVYETDSPRKFTTAFGDTVISREDQERGFDVDGNRVVGVFHRYHTKNDLTDAIRAIHRKGPAGRGSRVDFGDIGLGVRVSR